MTDAREIAAGLSDAQKRSILWLDGVTFKDWKDSKGPCRNTKTRKRIASLTEHMVQGAVSLYFMRRLNADGLAVRAVLMEGDGA